MDGLAIKQKDSSRRHWVSLVPFGLNQQHPNNFKDILDAVWENRDYCAPLRIWTRKVSGELMKTGVKLAQNDHNGKRQWTSEQKIGGVAQMSFGEWSIEHREFFAEWIVNNEKRPVQ